MFGYLQILTNHWHLYQVFQGLNQYYTSPAFNFASGSLALLYCVQFYGVLCVRDTMSGTRNKAMAGLLMSALGPMSGEILSANTHLKLIQPWQLIFWKKKLFFLLPNCKHIKKTYESKTVNFFFSIFLVPEERLLDAMNHFVNCLVFLFSLKFCPA